MTIDTRPLHVLINGTLTVPIPPEGYTITPSFEGLLCTIGSYKEALPGFGFSRATSFASGRSEVLRVDVEETGYTVVVVESIRCAGDRDCFFVNYLRPTGLFRHKVERLLSKIVRVYVDTLPKNHIPPTEEQKVPMCDLLRRTIETEAWGSL